MMWLTLFTASEASASVPLPQTTAAESAPPPQVTATQSLSTSTLSSQPSSIYSFRSHMTSSSVEIPQQNRRMEAYLSLGSYEDVLNSDFHYWEVRKQLMDNGMEMTRLWRLHTPDLRQRFDDEVEAVKKSRLPGDTVQYSKNVWQIHIHWSLFSIYWRYTNKIIIIIIISRSAKNSNWCHTFKMTAMTSFFAEKCCYLVNAHASLAGLFFK